MASQQLLGHSEESSFHLKEQRARHASDKKSYFDRPQPGVVDIEVTWVAPTIRLRRSRRAPVAIMP